MKTRQPPGASAASSIELDVLELGPLQPQRGQRVLERLLAAPGGSRCARRRRGRRASSPRGRSPSAPAGSSDALPLGHAPRDRRSASSTTSASASASSVRRDASSSRRGGRQRGDQLSRAAPVLGQRLLRARPACPLRCPSRQPVAPALLEALARAPARLIAPPPRCASASSCSACCLRAQRGSPAPAFSTSRIENGAGSTGRCRI